MGLIKEISQPTVLEQIQRINTNCLNTMKQSAKSVFQLMWHHPTQTPQQVCDQLGIDASKGFQAHAGLQQLIYLIDPTWVPLAPTHHYTANEDGTVTIGAPV